MNKPNIEKLSNKIKNKTIKIMSTISDNHAFITIPIIIIVVISIAITLIIGTWAIGLSIIVYIGPFIFAIASIFFIALNALCIPFFLIVSSGTSDRHIAAVNSHTSLIRSSIIIITFNSIIPENTINKWLPFETNDNNITLSFLGIFLIFSFFSYIFYNSYDGYDKIIGNKNKSWKISDYAFSLPIVIIGISKNFILPILLFICAFHFIKTPTLESLNKIHKSVKENLTKNSNDSIAVNTWNVINGTIYVINYPFKITSCSYKNINIEKYSDIEIKIIFSSVHDCIKNN